MDFSKLLDGFVKIDVWISLSCGYIHIYVEQALHNREMGERGTDVGFWAQQGQSC